jgi:hypothetical protein
MASLIIGHDIMKQRSWSIMKKYHLLAIIGGFAGLFIGLIAGGYIGLVLGGTFLGGFDIYEMTGIEGYELTTYIGAIIGAIIFTPIGFRYGSKKANNQKTSS